MRVDESFLQNNPVFQNASHFGKSSNTQPNTLTKKLQSVVGEFHGKKEDTIAPEMKEKLSQLTQGKEDVGVQKSAEQKSAEKLLEEYSEFLNNEQELFSKTVERINAKHQEDLEQKSNYESMLRGDTSMKEYMKDALSKEEYEKSPHTQTIKYADGTEKTQEVSYDVYKTVWDEEQKQEASRNVSAMLNVVTNRINTFPEYLEAATKAHDFSVRLAKAFVEGAKKTLGISTDTSAVSEDWEALNRTLKEELQNQDNEQIKVILEKSNELSSVVSTLKEQQFEAYA